MSAAPDAGSFIAAVATLRERVWANGWPPVPVLNWDYEDKPGEHKAGKAPIGDKWPELARRNPPSLARSRTH